MISSAALDADRGVSVAAHGDGRTEQDNQNWSSGRGGQEAFVERFGALIERMVAGALRHLRLASADVGPEDLLQDVYCRVFERGLATFEGKAPGQVVLYLKQVVRSTLISRMRADYALKRGGAWRRERLPAWHFTDPDLSPEGRVLERESRDQLLLGCRWLADQSCRDHRQNARIVALVLAGGWTSREVAAACGGRISPSGVDSLLWRCRRRLEACQAREREGCFQVTPPAPGDLPEAVHRMLRRALNRRSGTRRPTC